jgi:hypothetical protein
MQISSLLPPAFDRVSEESTANNAENDLEICSFRQVQQDRKLTQPDCHLIASCFEQRRLWRCLLHFKSMAIT